MPQAAGNLNRENVLICCTTLWITNTQHYQNTTYTQVGYLVAFQYSVGALWISNALGLE